MANTFATLQTIAREALPRLMENLVFPNLVNRDFSDTYTNLGDTIQIRKPNALSAADFSVGQAVNYADMTDSTVAVTMDKIATVDVAASAIETAVNIDDLNRVFIEPATVALAEKINADGLKMALEIPYAVGTPGTTPSTLAAFADARKLLNVNKAPISPRYGVWDPEADAAFTQIPSLVNAEKAGSTEALRNGSIGRVFGIDNYMAQSVAKVESGITASNAVKVNGAVQAGATSLAIDGTSLTGKLKKGEILTIAGHTYVVTEDTVDASSNAIAQVKVYPALPAIKDNTDVVIAGAHTANLVFNPYAFCFVSRPLVNPDGQGVEAYVTSYNGLSLRVVKGYDQQYKRSIYSMDILYGYKAVYPEMAVRVMG